MRDVVHLCRPTLPPPDKREILRYMGVKGEDGRMNSLVDECLDICKDFIDVRGCYSTFDVSVFQGVNSRSLEKRLDGCESAVIFAVTLGVPFDRLILRYSSVEPSRAVCLQAIGAERIEAACESIEALLIAQGHKKLRARYSAGYGDLPLDFQKDIFALLDCERKIGITLNESLLISPSKSVTAIVGIEK